MKTLHKLLATAITAAFVLVTTAPVVMADINNPQHLQNRGQQKVSNVKAKQWLQDGGNKNGYQQQQDQTIVNYGSKKAGTCNMNVGTTAPGQKAPKDVVVTAKDIINICK
ncbi:conserved exported hypothetical protein [Candidatus Terasakiella magnetica]|nr:conserved exported hypothetical protein [Candidatus Terasakiella magnetica]